MPASRDLDPYESLAALLGYELRRYRLAAEKTQEQTGKAVSYSPALIGAVETATKPAQLDLCKRLDKYFNTGGALERIWWHMNRFEAHPTWLQSYLEFERQATALRTFMPLAVPGLLQTEDYARALFRSGRPWDTAEQVEELVNARMARQAILSSDHPPMLRAVIDESALRRPIGNTNGGSAVMAAQLDALADAAQRPRIVVQVLSLSTGKHVGIVGGFTIASLQGSPDVVSLDTLVRGHLVDRSEDVAECVAVFDMLQAAAMPPDASLDLILRIRKEGYVA